MQFKYQAKDTSGNMRTGIVVAATQRSAEELLRENSLIILSLDLVREKFWLKMIPFINSVPTKELVLFSRQLATLITAQISILQALRILLSQVKSRRLLKIVNETISGIESGDSLSLSLSRHSDIFGTVYVNIVRSAELSGSLDKSLTYLADQMEKDYDLNAKITSALIYPIFIVCAIIVVGALMFLFVLPKLTEILQQEGAQLPLLTRGIINFTSFFGHFWWTFLVGAFALVGFYRYITADPQGRYAIDRIKISLPILGEIYQKIYLARFSRNLSTLIVGGIPIIKALEIVADLVNNSIYRKIILEGAEKLVAGKNISDALAGHSEMPQIVTQMIQVGEKTATLTNVLFKLAIYYEREVENSISSLTALIEPIIILVLGLAVGILVAGILLPIYNLASTAA